MTTRTLDRRLHGRRPGFGGLRGDASIFTLVGPDELVVAAAQQP